jgi:hypothetical protein
MDTVTTPGWAGTTYGDCELLGPVMVCPRALTMLTAETPASTANRQASLNNILHCLSVFFEFSVLISDPLWVVGEIGCAVCLAYVLAVTIWQPFTAASPKKQESSFTLFGHEPRRTLP